MPDIKFFDSEKISNALAQAGSNKQLCNSILQALRAAEIDADDTAAFRTNVRWPLVVGLLRDAKVYQVVLNNGIVFEVGLDSRIEQALLLSSSPYPDHVWEPQTTKLLVSLGLE